MLGLFSIILFFCFSGSAYRKYLTATYNYDYGNGGGTDYDQISVANPATTAMTPVTGRHTILTNCPMVNRKDNKAVSKSYLERVFVCLMGRGCGTFFLCG